MDDSEIIAPNAGALQEALALSSDILQDVELSRIGLSRIALKTSRLARLLNDFDFQKLMEFEAGGYPTTATGIPPDVWKVGLAAGRVFQYADPVTKKTSEKMYADSISELEERLQTEQTALSVAGDPDVSLSSANPSEYVGLSLRNNLNVGNRSERIAIRTGMNQTVGRLASRRAFIYSYVLRKHYELKYSGIADDIFARIRERVDGKIGEYLSEGIKKLSAVYDNLRSENPEDWSNAVHSCRRLLQELADALFPSTEEVLVVETEGEKLKVKLGQEEYINRLIAFIQDKTSSQRFREIVGSHLKYIGERLDSVFQAAQKGSHATVRKEEADRYVVYTYLIVGDILSLI